MPLLYPYAAGPSVPPSYTFVFPTDLGCFYSVEFYNRTGGFSGDHMLLNSGLIYEINITRTYLDQPPQKKERKFDSFVEPTLKEILNNFIRSNGTLPVYFYVCENSDEKEAARRKLFANRWYAQSSLNDWHLYNYELRESDTDREPWLLGLLIHENHPYTTQFPLAFEAFVKNEISLSKIVSTVLL